MSSLRFTSGVGAQVCVTDAEVQAALSGWAAWAPGKPAPSFPRRPNALAAAWARAGSSKPLPSANSSALKSVSGPPSAAASLPEDRPRSLGQTSQKVAAEMMSITEQHVASSMRHNQKPCYVTAADGRNLAAETPVSTPGTSISGTAFSHMMQAARAKPQPQHPERFVSEAVDGCKQLNTSAGNVLNH